MVHLVRLHSQLIRVTCLFKGYLLLVVGLRLLVQLVRVFFRLGNQQGRAFQHFSCSTIWNVDHHAKQVRKKTWFSFLKGVSKAFSLMFSYLQWLNFLFSDSCDVFQDTAGASPHTEAIPASPLCRPSWSTVFRWFLSCRSLGLLGCTLRLCRTIIQASAGSWCCRSWQEARWKVLRPGCYDMTSKWILCPADSMIILLVLVGSSSKFQLDSKEFCWFVCL